MAPIDCFRVLQMERPIHYSEWVKVWWENDTTLSSTRNFTELISIDMLKNVAFYKKV